MCTQTHESRNEKKLCWKWNFLCCKHTLIYDLLSWYGLFYYKFNYSCWYILPFWCCFNSCKNVKIQFENLIILINTRNNNIVKEFINCQIFVWWIETLISKAKRKMCAVKFASRFDFGRSCEVTFHCTLFHFQTAIYCWSWLSGYWLLISRV